MKAAFGNDFEELAFTPAADQKIQLQVGWRTLKRPQSAADLSDGTLRFLFLLTVLASPTPAPVIAIDEPEVGLHPGMLPIVAEHAVDAALRSQVILTTHSPQFLDAFRRWYGPTMNAFEAAGKNGKSDDLARELGMSKKTLYAHFTSKEELLRAVLVRRTTEIDRGLEAIVGARESFPAKLGHLARFLQSQVAKVSPVFLEDIRRYAPDCFQVVEEFRGRAIPRYFPTDIWKARFRPSGLGA